MIAIRNIAAAAAIAALAFIAPRDQAQAQFLCMIANGTNINCPSSGNIAGTTDSQTLTNKTLTAPAISGTSSGSTTLQGQSAASGTLTLPSVTDTLAVLGTAQSFTAAQTFPASGIKLLGSSTGATTFSSANAGASNFTLTVPASTDTLVGRATTDTLTNKSIASSEITGTTTNDSASAGNIGEYVVSTVAVGSAVSLTTNTAANITSISLTAGDWDVSAICASHLAGTTSISAHICQITTTSATLSASVADGAVWMAWSAFVPGFDLSTGIPPMRQSLSGTTTVYLVVKDVFTVSTDGGYGVLRARRVR